ncbi:protein phosphatase 2C domain-containing protein [Actinosynnema sp. CS-041913]|uniref:protein phosphatase 2C domain-containing protein n=1 Tax=Actinosynnema sp. CS-041913 TaxID=3239917 RepID=UPI003D8E3754
MARVRGGLTMETVFATSAGDNGVNEDAVVAGDDFAVVLDGATAEPDTDTGCVHGVRWFVRQLAGGLAGELALDASKACSLADVLHDAVAAVGRSHADTCDLGNLCSPSSTVAILRQRDRHVDHLVLGDSPIVLEGADGSVTPVVDDRLARYTGSWADLRHIRNVPGGFWVAGNTPGATRHALVGTAPVAGLRRAALLTDGVTRLVERYGWTWRDLVGALDETGPAEVVARTREAERRSAGRFVGKLHDDATAALCRFASDAGSGADRD